MDFEFGKEDSLISKLEADFSFMSQQTLNALELVNSFESKPARSQHMRHLLSQNSLSNPTNSRPWSISKNENDHCSTKLQSSQCPVTVDPRLLLKSSVSCSGARFPKTTRKPMLIKKIQASSPLKVRSGVRKNEKSATSQINSARSNLVPSTLSTQTKIPSKCVGSVVKQETSTVTEIAPVRISVPGVLPAPIDTAAIKHITPQKSVSYFPPPTNNITSIVKAANAVAQPGTSLLNQPLNYGLPKTVVHNKPIENRGVTKSLTSNTTTALVSKNFKSLSHLPLASRLMQPTAASAAKATKTISRIVRKPDSKDNNVGNVTCVSTNAPPLNTSDVSTVGFKSANSTLQQVNSQSLKSNLSPHIPNACDKSTGNNSSLFINATAGCSLNDIGTASTPIRQLPTVAEIDKSLTPSIDFANFSNFSYVADWAQTPLLAKRALIQQNVNTERLFGAIPMVDIEATFGLERRKQQQQQSKR